ncbi:MAG: hypothetical protein GY725_10950 [bacterium]|nr:hypothetical protein [bacterium]
MAEIQKSNGPEFSGGSAEVRARLRDRVPWLRALWTLRTDEDREVRFMGEAQIVDGVPLQIVEMMREPGDVVFMHPWLLHTIAPNSRERARIVLTDRLHAYAHPNSVPYQHIEKSRTARQASDRQTFSAASVRTW